MASKLIFQLKPAGSDLGKLTRMKNSSCVLLSIKELKREEQRSDLGIGRLHSSGICPFRT